MSFVLHLLHFNLVPTQSPIFALGPDIHVNLSADYCISASKLSLLFASNIVFCHSNVAKWEIMGGPILKSFSNFQSPVWGSSSTSGGVKPPSPARQIEHWFQNPDRNNEWAKQLLDNLTPYNNFFRRFDHTFPRTQRHGPTCVYERRPILSLIHISEPTRPY